MDNDLDDDILGTDILDGLDSEDFEEGDDDYEEDFRISNSLYFINTSSVDRISWNNYRKYLDNN